MTPKAKTTAKPPPITDKLENNLLSLTSCID